MIVIASFINGHQIRDAYVFMGLTTIACSQFIMSGFSLMSFHGCVWPASVLPPPLLLSFQSCYYYLFFQKCAKFNSSLYIKLIQYNSNLTHIFPMHIVHFINYFKKPLLLGYQMHFRNVKHLQSLVLSISFRKARLAPSPFRDSNALTLLTTTLLEIMSLV